MLPTSFLEVFVLGVCVTGFGAVVLYNALHLKASHRLGLGILIVGLAYIVAAELQKHSTSPTVPPVASNATSKEAPPMPPAKQTNSPDQPAEKTGAGPGSVIPVPAERLPAGPGIAVLVSNPPETVTSPDAEAASSIEPTSNSLRVEVLYDGPTAAGGVINPRDIMSKELRNVGLEVSLSGATLSAKPTGEPAPAAPEPRTVTTAQPGAPVTPPTANPADRPPVVPKSPSSPTVKEIFDFVRKAQQGEWMNGPAPTGGFLSLSTPLYAASPPVHGFVVVAMRASMRHLNENQGIFSTEANMQIAAVTSRGKNIQSVVMMAGPETVRGFGLDWDRAEEAALKDISAKMCPAFAKDLYQKLTGNK